MSSRIRRRYSFVSTIIAVILIPLLLLEVIPGLYGLVFLGFSFLIMTIVLPMLEVKGIKEYYKSLSDSSLTTLTINAKNFNEDEFNSDKIKYYPKKQVNLIVITFVLVGLGILTIVLSLLFPMEIPIEIIVLLLVSMFVLLSVGLIYLFQLRKNHLKLIIME